MTAQARGEWCEPLRDSLPATSKPPGMTGTGVPVTEQLRYRLAGELGWYREHLRPYLWAEFIFL